MNDSELEGYSSFTTGEKSELSEYSKYSISRESEHDDPYANKYNFRPVLQGSYSIIQSGKDKPLGSSNSLRQDMGGVNIGLGFEHQLGENGFYAFGPSVSYWRTNFENVMDKENSYSLKRTYMIYRVGVRIGYSFSMPGEFEFRPFAELALGRGTIKDETENLNSGKSSKMSGKSDLVEGHLGLDFVFPGGFMIEGKIGYQKFDLGLVKINSTERKLEDDDQLKMGGALATVGIAYRL